MKVKIDHKGRWIAALILVIAALCCYWGANIYLNYLNIAEVGKEYVTGYISEIKTDVILRIIAFIIAEIAVIITTKVIQRNLLKWDETAVFLKGKATFIIGTTALAIFISACLPYKTAYSAMMATNPTWFLHSDPIFNKNIGYYVFQRPFYKDISVWAYILTAVLFAYSVIMYFMYYVRNGGGKLRNMLSRHGIMKHLTVGILLILAVTVFSAGFYAEEFMFSDYDGSVGGKYTTMVIWSNLFRITPYLLTVVGILVLIMVWKRMYKSALYVALTYPAMLVLVLVGAVAVQGFVVRPNEASVERYYIKNNIDYTRQAYKLDEVTEMEYGLSGTIAEEGISQNAAELESVRMIDENTVLGVYNQLQSLRDSYEFKDVDYMKYRHESKEKSAYIAVREIKNDEEMSYIDRKLKFTHGFGVAACGVSGSGADFITDETGGSTLKITQPRIYFGETEEEYVIANSFQKEFDGYEGNVEKEFSYDGGAGINLSFVNRMLYAAKLMDFNLAVSGYFTENSKILTNVNVIDRAELAFPYLTFDDDPYITVSQDGRILWVIDAYTTTNYYPYAQRIYDFDDEFGTNYVRNSVKITVDAYSGEVTGYITDWNDPIIRTYSKMYPESFAKGSIPFDIFHQIKYPEKLFRVQTEMFKRYHTTNPSTFYSNSDVWEFAKEKTGTGPEIKTVEPYYIRSNLLGNSGELMMMAPYTVANKDSILSAWLVVSSNRENYGNLTLFTFPRDKQVSGSLQIENKIDGDTAVTEELEKLKNDKSRIIRGNMTILPIMDTVVYIEPVYTMGQAQGALPELKKVIAVCGDGVVIENTMAEAMLKLLQLKPETDYSVPEGEIVISKEDDLTETMSELLKNALAKYREAQQFSKEGDWVNYGRTMKEFEDMAGKLEYGLIYGENREQVEEAPLNEVQ